MNETSEEEIVGTMLGEYDGDELHLYYPVRDSFYYDSGISEYMVTLRKNGSGGWWFYSNGAK